MHAWVGHVRPDPGHDVTTSGRRPRGHGLGSPGKQTPLPRPVKAAKAAPTVKRKAGKPRLSKTPPGRAELVGNLGAAIEALEAKLEVRLN